MDKEPFYRLYTQAELDDIQRDMIEMQARARDAMKGRYTINPRITQAIKEGRLR